MSGRWTVRWTPNPARPGEYDIRFDDVIVGHGIVDRYAKKLVDDSGGEARVVKPDGRTVAVYTSTPKDGRLAAAR